MEHYMSFTGANFEQYSWIIDVAIMNYPMALFHNRKKGITSGLMGISAWQRIDAKSERCKGNKFTLELIDSFENIFEFATKLKPNECHTIRVHPPKNRRDNWLHSRNFRLAEILPTSSLIKPHVAAGISRKNASRPDCVASLFDPGGKTGDPCRKNYSAAFVRNVKAQVMTNTRQWQNDEAVVQIPALLPMEDMFRLLHCLDYLFDDAKEQDLGFRQSISLEIESRWRGAVLQNPGGVEAFVNTLYVQHIAMDEQRIARFTLKSRIYPTFKVVIHQRYRGAPGEGRVGISPDNGVLIPVH